MALFAGVCCAVVAVNVVIVLREHQAGGQLEQIRRYLDPEQRANAGKSDESGLKPSSALSALNLKAEDTARNLASLQAAEPSALLVTAGDRLRQLTAEVSSLTQRLVNLSLIPDQPESESLVEPRIVYARYEVVDEFLELAGPPDTSRNPVTYDFTISYFGELFPAKHFGEIRLGQLMGNFKLEAVNVETRRGPVVKDEIVRYRRRKGGVMEPVWSHRRLPSEQVLVFELSSLADRSRHEIHWPAGSNSEQDKVRREVSAGWVEIWENNEECSNRFPVMKGSEFSWSGHNYRVDEVTIQELKLTEMNSGEQARWPRGGGP